MKHILVLAFLLASCASPFIPPVQVEPTQIKPTQVIQAVPTPIRMATVSAWRSVNIRRLPTEHSVDIGDLWHGQTVRVVGCFGGWAKIGEAQFVNSRYLNDICKK